MQKHSGVRLASLFKVFALIVFSASIISAQDKDSVWKKIKKATGTPAPDDQSKPQNKPQSNNSNSQQSAAKNPNSGSNPPAGTKIDQKLLAPYQPQSTFFMSPKGVHVATVDNSGSRPAVIYDGTVGPKFDEILRQDQASVNQIVFSPDGTRYAYCARSGSEFVVIVDGKEVGRSSEANMGRLGPGSCKLGFTADSKHFFYFTTGIKSMTSGDGYVRFVFDGKSSVPTAPSDGTPFPVAFSPDGNHYAHICNDPAKQKPWTLIVDGKPTGYQGGAPQWTADSKHIYSQVTFNSPATHTNGVDLLLDGKPIVRAQGLRFFVAPAGDLMVAIINAPAPSHAQFLSVGTKRVPGSDLEQGVISDIVFSPDGKHYAAKYQDANNRYYVFSDGKRGQDYQFIDGVQFTADSSQLVYHAMANSRQFLIVGGQESKGFSNAVTPIFAPAGGHVGALVANSMDGVFYLLDAKATAVNARGLDKFTFSPDGTHFAFLEFDSGMGRHLAIDGVLLQGSNLFQNNIAPAGELAFSPDWKHYAHVANSPNPSQPTRGIFADGKFFAESQDGNSSNLTFTPDGQHLFWVHQTGDNLMIYMDGKVVASGRPAANTNSQGWWEMSPDGTLLCLLQSDEGINRVSITPPAGSGLSALAGGGN
jgi:hypothetical protein